MLDGMGKRPRDFPEAVFSCRQGGAKGSTNEADNRA